MAVEPHAARRAEYDPAADAEFPPPDLGRTVHVVGTVVNVDPEDTPHPKVRRGEVGKALLNYLRNTVAVDPLGRTNSTRFRDQRNYFTAMLRQTPAGTINPTRTRVDDPAAMSRHIKRVGRFFGADAVGIIELAGSGPFGDADLTRPAFAIVCALQTEHDTTEAFGIGGQAPALKGLFVSFNLCAVIKEMGYRAFRSPDDRNRLAGLARVGVQGRGRHVAEVVCTDLPLQADQREVAV